MKFRKIPTALLAMATGLIMVPGAAMAAPAEATTALNVRSGPGTGYRVVDVLRAGENVEVERCQGGWCRIEHNGPDGWVSDNYLRIYRDGRPGRPTRPSPDPDVSFCVDTPGFDFGINCRDRDRPGRPVPPRRGEICFYEDFNYRGASFCARPGESDRRLSGFWNDRISSIRIRGNASATVCEHWDYGGRCAQVGNSISAIGGRNNDVISSYRIR